MGFVVVRKRDGYVAAPVMWRERVCWELFTRSLAAGASNLGPAIDALVVVGEQVICFARRIVRRE